MHSQSNSDGSSSPVDNRRPLYFVQSPSSQQSTPALSSVIASPQSSHSYYSTDLSSHSSEETNHDHAARRRRNWEEFHRVDEGEGLLGEDEEESGKGKSGGWSVVMFIAGFVVLFTLFSLILSSASKHQNPEIIMQSITFYRFSLQAGTDDTGVVTDMINVNASLIFTFQNRGTFFGLHVSSMHLTLSYTQIIVAFGNMEEFFQKRDSARNTSVLVTGNQIPMYGSGAPLVTPKGLTTGPVPLQLSFMARSRAHVFGELVRTTFIQNIDCSFDFSVGKFDVAIPLTNSCTYK